ncbi:MAG: hypothetical protein BIFFINMI_01744 [Phycisphaerae bacterium]|nr:hypothetical protein [Phycisphaerae bacterium]
MIRSLAHACFIVADLERTRKFYCDGLGMKLAFEFKRDTGERYGFYLSCGGRTFLEFFKGAPGPRPEGVSYRHISLEVEDLDAAIAQLAAVGVEAKNKKLGNDKSWQAWTEDPDGNPIELHCYTPDSAQVKALESCK